MSNQISDQLKEMLGVVAFEMVNVITDDLSGLLEKKQSQKNEAAKASMEAAVDGYLLALSRILEPKVSWQCIVESFRRNNLIIPSKYYKLFSVQEKSKQEK